MDSALIPPLLAFAGTALIVTIVPGLDTAMVLRTAALQSRRHGVLAALGIGLGCLSWGAAVALGLGALLAASSLAFTALKWAGAAYLLWLGARLLIDHRPAYHAEPTTPSTDSLAAAFRSGFATNILNPKVGVFYLTLLPQFIPTGAPVGFTFLLACVHVTIAVLWFFALSVAVAVIGTFLRRPAVARRLNMLTGTVFCVFGARLMLAGH